MIKKIIIIAGIIITIAITLAYFLITDYVATKVTIVNQSNLSIESATASLNYEKINFTNINSGENISKKIKITGDGSINIKIELSDKTTLEGKSSYVTGNDGTNNIFTITTNKNLEYEQE